MDIELIASTLSSPQMATAAKIVLPKPSSDNVTVDTFNEEVEASSDSDCDDDGQDYLKNLLNPINMSDSDLDEIQAVCEKINSGTASPMPEPSSISHQQKSSHPFNLLENNNTDISMLLGKIDVSSNNLGPAAMFDNVVDQPPPTVSGTSTPPIEIYPTFFDDDISEFGLTSGTNNKEGEEEKAVIKKPTSTKASKKSPNKSKKRKRVDSGSSDNEYTGKKSHQSPPN